MKLKINNITANLTNAISLNKVGYSFKDWLSKQVTFSRKITVSKSNELDALFLRPKHLEINSNSFGTFYNFEISEFNQIFYQGIAILLGVNSSNEYEIQLIDTSFVLFKNLDNNLTSLKNIDNSDFVFNINSYNNLKNLNNSLWLWSGSNMHVNRTLTNNILSGNLAFSRPFFSVKKILEKAFEQNGWTYELSKNAEFIDKLLISSNHSNFYFCSYDKLFTNININGIVNLTGSNFIKTDSIVGLETIKLNYDSHIHIRGYITANQDTILTITGTSSAGNDNLTDTLTINKGTNYYDIVSSEFATDDATFDVQISVNNQVIFDDVYVYTKIEEAKFGNISDANFTDFKVKTYDNLPEVSLLSLFKHSLVSVAGFFNSDNLKKKIIVNSIANLSKLSAYDWTEKLIENTINVSVLEDYGKINSYEYDNKEVQNLGKGTFEIDNNTFADSKIIYKSIFGAGSEVLISNYQIDIPIYDNIERIETNIRLAYFETVNNYTIARFKQLYGLYILDNQYKNFTDALKESKVITAEFNLNKTDFLTFDFTRLIYLEQLKSTFYVIDIKDFIKGKTTKLTLLKTK